MAIIAPPNPESRSIAKWFTDHEQRIKRVEAGLRTAQLGNSSLNGNGLDMFDADGNYRGTIGFQGDGNTTVTSVNPLPPPVPGAPTVTPALASLIVTHSGETADGTGNPSDFSHLNVYTADVGLPEVRTFRGTINPVPGEFPITGLDYAQYLVTVTGVNLSGKESAHSAPSSGTASQAVSADLINGIIQAVHLNAGIVTEATLAANAVTSTKIADNSVSSPKIIAGAITAGKLAVDSVNAGNIIAGSVTTEKVAALAITANEIATNAITAGKITTGAVTAVKLEANMVIATRIIAGSATGARVEMHPTSGLQAFLSNGTTRTFWINSSTGEAFFSGEIETAASGTRIVINPGGVSPDEMRFYQGSVYSYLNAELAPGSTAALVGRSQTVSSIRGAFGCYPTEAFIAVQDATSSRAAVSCISTATNIWGGGIDLQFQEAWGGNNRISFTRRTSGGTFDGVFSVDIRRLGLTGAPMMYRPNTDQGIVWSSTDMYSSDLAGNPRAFSGAAYITSSGRETKKNIKVATIDSGKSARQGLKDITIKSWNYLNERAPGDPAPTRKKRIRKEVRYNEKNQPMVDTEGNTLYEEIEEFADEQPVTKPYIGFVAEELISAGLSDLVVEQPHMIGGYGVRDMELIAFLWMVNQEQDQELVALRTELDKLKVKVR